MTTFAIVGAGWRSEFYLRVAAALPDRFTVTALVTRRPARAAELGGRFGVRTVDSLDALDALDMVAPDFVVACVTGAATAGVTVDLVDRGWPVLVETPPGSDRAQLTVLAGRVADGAVIQVAEQYPFQPLHAARLAIVRSGLLGSITSAQLSVAHGYHAVALLRLLLGCGRAPASAQAQTFTSPLTAGPDRAGPPAAAFQVDSDEIVAVFTIGDQLGVVDWAESQYFSWIRGLRMLVRGTHGEIDGLEVRSLHDHVTPVHQTLRRWDLGHEGELEGYSHRGYLLGDRWVYRNPFEGARLSDDEIAVASVLDGMGRHVAGGAPVYELAEAAHDTLLANAAGEAATTGTTVHAAPLVLT